jgi:hypothetical protein
VKLSSQTVIRAIRAGDLEASRLTEDREGWRIRDEAILGRLETRSTRSIARSLPGVRTVEPAGPRRPWRGSAAVRANGRAGALRAGPEVNPPPQPDTRRGIEPRLRRGPDGQWIWRFRVRWKEPGSGRRPAPDPAFGRGAMARARLSQLAATRLTGAVWTLGRLDGVRAEGGGEGAQRVGAGAGAGVGR